MGTMSALRILSFDTGPLPPTLVAQATVPTGDWIEVYASAQADKDCEAQHGGIAALAALFSMLRQRHAR